MGKGVSGQRPPRYSWCWALAWPRCPSRSLSFVLVVVCVWHRSRLLSFALVIVHARCRLHPLSFALIVVCVRYRSRSLPSAFVVIHRLFFHRVVAWEVLAANCKWGVYQPVLLSEAFRMDTCPKSILYQNGHFATGQIAKMMCCLRRVHQ